MESSAVAPPSVSNKIRSPVGICAQRVGSGPSRNRKTQGRLGKSPSQRLAKSAASCLPSRISYILFPGFTPINSNHFLVIGDFDLANETLGVAMAGVSRRAGPRSRERNGGSRPGFGSRLGSRFGRLAFRLWSRRGLRHLSNRRRQSICGNHKQHGAKKENRRSFHGTMKSCPDGSLTFVPEALPLTSRICFVFGSKGLKTKPGLFGTNFAVGIPAV